MIFPALCSDFGCQLRKFRNRILKRVQLRFRNVAHRAVNRPIAKLEKDLVAPKDAAGADDHAEQQQNNVAGAKRRNIINAA